MQNKIDGGSQKKKALKAVIQLSSDVREVGSSGDAISNDKFEALGSAVFNLGREFE